MSEANYYTVKLFTENLLVMEMRKTQIIMNKPVYLGLSILDQIKTVMYKFWHVKPKFDDKAKLCYMAADSFIIHVKSDDIYKGIAEDIETGLGISNLNCADHYRS